MTGGDFRSMIFPTQYDVPEYNRWLLHEADMAPAYRWHRIYLQHLQSRHAGERWLLKSPAHLWCLGALLAEYPDAVIVQTHRDPVRVISSISALVALLRSMASDHSSVARAAEQYSEDILLGLERSIEARRDGTLPAGQVVDVQFHEFMADPVRHHRRPSTTAVGLEFTAEAESRMRCVPRHPSGRRRRWWQPVHVRRDRPRRRRASASAAAPTRSTSTSRAKRSSDLAGCDPQVVPVRGRSTPSPDAGRQSGWRPSTRASFWARTVCPLSRASGWSTIQAMAAAGTEGGAPE